MMPIDCDGLEHDQPPKRVMKRTGKVTTPKGDGPTTKGYGDEQTDLPQEDIDDALILDYGRYTTVSFHYEQHQWMHTTWADRCFDEYAKCLTGLHGPSPVCMFYTQRWASGYKYKNSYCDAYFENCRIGYRYWRIIAYGKCDLGYYFFGWDAIIEV